MSIAGVYVQIVDGKERYKSLAYRVKRSTDDQLIRLPCQDRRLLAEMAAKSSSKSETLANRIKRFFSAQLADDEDVQPQERPQLAPLPEPENSAQASAFAFPLALNLKQKKCCKETRKCCCTIGLAGRILYVVLSILTVFKALGLIVVAGIVAVAVRAYDTEHAEKAASLVLLMLSAGLSIVLVIWSSVAFFKKQTKRAKRLALFVFLLASFQLILTLVSVTPNAKGQQRLTEELSESLEKAKQNNQKHLKQWSATQYGLSCCGLNSPEDYRIPHFPLQFPPDVPISCCPAFDPNRPTLTQERERELCKSRRTYYTAGCANMLGTYFTEAGIAITSLVTGLFFIQIFLALWTCCGQKLDKKKLSVEAPEAPAAAPATPTPNS